MINRRRFLQGVAGGLALSPILTYGFPEALTSGDRSIPSWIPRYKHTTGQGDLFFEDLFAKDFFLGRIASHEKPESVFDLEINETWNVFHQNLYDPPMMSIEQDEKIVSCIISAKLKDIYDLESLHLFEEFFHKAYYPFGCLALPPNAETIVSILDDKHFKQSLNRLPCPVILIDAKAIEKTVSKLPTLKPHSNNADRILQSTIISILSPLVVQSFIAIDGADFQSFLKTSKLVCMGIGFMNHSETDLDLAAENAFNTIYDQIAPGRGIAQKFDSCWINVCGNFKNLTMDKYEAIANKICSDVPEESNIFVGITVDDGLEDDIMITCFAAVA